MPKLPLARTLLLACAVAALAAAPPARPATPVQAPSQPAPHRSSPRPDLPATALQMTVNENGPNPTIAAPSDQPAN